MKASFKKPITTKLSILILAGFLLCSLQSCGQEKETKPAKKTKPDYSNVDYSARSNIIKRPKELKGDEKAIFYHPYFLKLTSKQAKELKPLKVKEEFEKLGITTKENDRFIEAYIFLDTSMKNHKKSCEQWESFKDLVPKSQN